MATATREKRPAVQRALVVLRRRHLEEERRLEIQETDGSFQPYQRGRCWGLAVAIGTLERIEKEDA